MKKTPDRLLQSDNSITYKSQFINRGKNEFRHT